MKTIIALSFSMLSIIATAQSRNGAPVAIAETTKDSLIRSKLIELAMKNPAIPEADALVRGSQYELKRAKSSWLNSITLAGNINEFVINGTEVNGISAATLYPKYNAGVNIPLGIFGRQESNIARERVKVYEAQHETRRREIIKQVLVAYENYKEKKDLLELQKQVTEGQNSTYKAKQKDLASGDIKDVADVNKEYSLWIQERSKQRTSEADLRIAELELEQLIGVKISDVIAEVESGK